MQSTLKFYLLLIKDIVIYIKNLFFPNKELIMIKHKLRKEIGDTTVYVCVHEWGGYPISRKKTLKDGKTFLCGLKAQLVRYEQGRKNGLVNLTVTMSDCEKCKDLEYIKERTDSFIEVSNIGMDFSGYGAFYRIIQKHSNNAYVILSNSSVDSEKEDFLKGYINYMEKNLDVGILGISYSTKIYQTLISDNFNPHVQSFFLLTTIDVLKEVVKLNGGHFPGENICDKRLLIREGEVGISKIVLSLGYNLAVVYPGIGKPFKFKNKSEWNKPFGDIRLIVNHPNRITPIKE